MAFHILDLFAPWEKRDEAEYKQQINNDLESITAPKFDDGAREVESNENEIQYNSFNQMMFGSNEPGMKTTADLINTYRSLMNNYEVDNAVEEIVSDAVVYEDGHPVRRRRRTHAARYR